ncbi:MAG: hypothetical protein E6K44_11155 [Gammaproteobacteria bacterium]|nr:MAG: hypothetical protein E6K44_11155 [Gammaproteobacteria bacterium]
MATARDRAFKILTEREIREILQDRAGRTPRELGGWPGVDQGFHPGPASSLPCEEFESGTPYWGTWETV